MGKIVKNKPEKTQKSTVFSQISRYLRQKTGKKRLFKRIFLVKIEQIAPDDG